MREYLDTHPWRVCYAYLKSLLLISEESATNTLRRMPQEAATNTSETATNTFRYGDCNCNCECGGVDVGAVKAL